MALVMVPLLVLYTISIGLAAIGIRIFRRRTGVSTRETARA
jgi:Sec-independent protein secretion pathway component TatC